MPSKLKADTRDLKLSKSLNSKSTIVIENQKFFKNKIVVTETNVFITYDLHVRGVPPRIEALVESMATPILLLSLLEHFPVIE